MQRVEYNASYIICKLSGVFDHSSTILRLCPSLGLKNKLNSSIQCNQNWPCLSSPTKPIIEQDDIEKKCLVHLLGVSLRTDLLVD